MALLQHDQAESVDQRRAVAAMAPAAWLSGQLEAERAGWFYWLPVAFGTGCSVYFALSFEPSVALATALAIAASILVALRPGSTLAGALVAVVAFAVFGFCAAKLRTEWVRAPVLEKRLGPVKVRGFVELIEPKADWGARLTLRPISIGKLKLDDLPYRIRVRIRDDAGALALGDAVELTARLSPPPRSAIPGGYDFARYAWFQRIGAVGFSTSPSVRIEAEQVPTYLRFANDLARLRKSIGDRVVAALPGETGAVANALITGERGGIPESTNDIYRAAGIYHILSISGLHMAIMGGAVFFALRFALALWPAVALRYPIKKWAAVGAMFGAFGYLLISGGSFATVRAFLMITVMFLAILTDRQAIALRNVAIAAFLILIVFPESVTDVGFQMSFAAVIALTASYETLARRLKPSGDATRSRLFRFAFFFIGITLTTVIASAAIAPFAIYHFHQNQHYAVLANLAAIPLCNFLVMPGALATLVLMPLGLEAWPLALMGYGIELMTMSAGWVAGLNGAVSYIPAVPDLTIILFVAGGLWLTLMSQRWRLAGWLPIAAGIAVAPITERPAILVGSSANLVLVRGAEGRLNGIVRPRDDYEVSQWLARDGDARGSGELTASPILSCDDQICVGAVQGKLVAIAGARGAPPDACKNVDLLITSGRRPRKCSRTTRIIDRRAVDRQGAHAVYINPAGDMRIETAEEIRGIRPWTLAREHGVRRRTKRSQAKGNATSPGETPPVLADWRQ